MQDAELLQMLCAEPEQGMQMLIRHYSGYVYTIVKNKLSGCGTHEDFEETVSDVFIRFYEWVRKAPETCGSIRAVLAVIAKRQAVSRFRALTKQPPCESYEGLLSEQPDSAAAPDESVLLMQTVKALGEPESEIGASPTASTPYSCTRNPPCFFSLNCTVFPVDLTDATSVSISSNIPLL